MNNLPTQDGVSYLRIISSDEVFMQLVSTGELWIQEMTAKMGMLAKMEHVMMTNIDVLTKGDSEFTCGDVFNGVFNGKNRMGSSLVVRSPVNLQDIKSDEVFVLFGLYMVEHVLGDRDMSDIDIGGYLKIDTRNIENGSVYINPPLMLARDDKVSIKTTNDGDNEDEYMFSFVLMIGNPNRDYMKAKKEIEEAMDATG